jgi:hypothetical protein
VLAEKPARKSSSGGCYIRIRGTKKVSEFTKEVYRNVE